MTIMHQRDAEESLRRIVAPFVTVWTVATYSARLHRSVKLLIVDRDSGDMVNISVWVASILDLPLDARHGGVQMATLSRYRRAEDLLAALSYRIFGKGDQFGHRWI